jgi:hypothetical protein
LQKRAAQHRDTEGDYETAMGDDNNLPKYILVARILLKKNNLTKPPASAVGLSRHAFSHHPCYFPSGSASLPAASTISWPGDVELM